MNYSHYHKNWERITLSANSPPNNKNILSESLLSWRFLKTGKQFFNFCQSALLFLILLLYRFSKRYSRNINFLRQQFSVSALYLLIGFLITIIFADYLFAFTGYLETRPPVVLIEEAWERKDIVEESIVDFQKSQDQNLKNKDFQIATLSEEEASQPPSPILTTFGGGAFISSEKEFGEHDSVIEKTEIETYIVQSGETLSSIAQKFGISIQTILWENKLTIYSILRPGQELKILPISGLTHRVQKNDTLASIAKLYQASVEDILDFNNLADASDIYVGDLLIVPEGKLPPPPRPPKSKPKDRTWLVQEGLSTKPSGENCHVFVAGQCTWYVARKRCTPWTGHAKSWISNAQRLGFTISREPAAGAIISLKETSWTARRYGHVGYVEAFDEDTVTFSEMNHIGPWVITRRTLKRNDPRIIGYIL